MLLKHCIYLAIEFVAALLSGLGHGYNHVYGLKSSSMKWRYVMLSLLEGPTYKKSAWTISLGFSPCSAVTRGRGLLSPFFDMMQCI